jgi:membrane protease YdiL (CAAX protease family)
MMPMPHRLGAFRAALLTGWLALSAAGLVYARQKDIPLWAAIPIITAFLLEYSFYLAPGFEPVRDALRTRLSGWRLPLAMAVSAIAPYLAYSIPTGQFHWTPFAELVALTLVICFWYVAMKPSPIADVLFLAVLPAIVLARVFNVIYTSPIPIRIDVLGKLMLIRTGVMVILELRRAQGIGFGFLPTQHEWFIGVRYFFYFLPVGFPLALWLGLVQLNFTGFVFWKTLATFFGTLWVLALSEEFFFRGLIQNWLTAWTGKPKLALVAASLVFGAAHLPFRGFPNWKFAVVAAVSGLFYGSAYRAAGSIRAGMVTHALVVTVLQSITVLV